MHTVLSRTSGQALKSAVQEGDDQVLHASLNQGTLPSTPREGKTEGLEQGEQASLDTNVRGPTTTQQTAQSLGAPT